MSDQPNNIMGVLYVILPIFLCGSCNESKDFLHFYKKFEIIDAFSFFL